MKGIIGRRKLNNQGSAMVMVLSMIAFIAILGAIAMSTSLVNIKMRGMNRASDKNFYYLETALDEIYAQLGRESSEVLKEEYAVILGRLYQEEAETGSTPEKLNERNEKANEALKNAFIKGMADENRFHLDINMGEEASGKQNCMNAAARLEKFATTFLKSSDSTEQTQLAVSVGAVSFEKEPSVVGQLQEVYSSLVFKDVCLTYVNPETDTESALTVDLRIDVPYVQFINSGDALFDYILVANSGILAVSGNGVLAGSAQNVWNGKVYGGQISVDHATLTANSALMTSAGNLTVKNGSLKVGPDAEAGGESRVWAKGIELSSGAVLDAKNSSFFVRDDMTLTKNRNQVTLGNGSSYYGYGNEGKKENGTIVEDSNTDNSSAILLNDKNSLVDFSNLDSLMLAGRAYLRFSTAAAGTSADSQYIYPMGESLAVRATQSMYLMPESAIAVDGKKAEMNPVVMSEMINELTIRVEVSAGIQDYVVKRSADGELTIDGQSDDAPAFLVALSGTSGDKIYVYHNFKTNEERSLYFESYLKNNTPSFEALLKKGGMTAADSGVLMNEDGQILASGSLYQVSGNNAEGEPLFSLVGTRKDGVSNSLKWVDFADNLKKSFENLQINLAESLRVSRGSEAQSGFEKTLPLGNYVRLDKLENLKKANRVLYKKQDDSEVFLSGTDIELQVGGTDCDVSSTTGGKTHKATMHQGLIVSGGNVEITGAGKFDGLIMAAGTVTINGEEITLTADPQAYEALLTQNEDAAEELERVTTYFYDYGDAASTVLNHYEDFVTKENWSRTGLEQGGTADEESK